MEGLRLWDVARLQFGGRGGGGGCGIGLGPSGLSDLGCGALEVTEGHRPIF